MAAHRPGRPQLPPGSAPGPPGRAPARRASRLVVPGDHCDLPSGSPTGHLDPDVLRLLLHVDEAHGGDIVARDWVRFSAVPSHDRHLAPALTPRVDGVDAFLR